MKVVGRPLIGRDFEERVLEVDHFDNFDRDPINFVGEIGREPMDLFFDHWCKLKKDLTSSIVWPRKSFFPMFSSLLFAIKPQNLALQFSGSIWAWKSMSIF